VVLHHGDNMMIIGAGSGEFGWMELVFARDVIDRMVWTSDGLP